jgi:Mannose-6-phosphate isomerase
MDSTTLVGAGCLACIDGDRDYDELVWNKHPTFAGVSLKHLLTSADTGGALSAHLVRIQAGCCLETHTHPNSLELHEVVSGSGKAELAGRSASYAPGVCGLIPAGVAHSVRANAEQDLYILAKFAPALL